VSVVAPSAHSPPEREPSTAFPRAGERIVHFESSPGKVGIEVENADSLIERNASPGYPHTGPMLNGSVAAFLVDSVREQRRQPNIEITVSVLGPPLRADEEARRRAQINNFFANEAELSGLEVRVNRTEGLGSLRYAIPLVVLAGLVAGVFYANLGTLSRVDYLTALGYLVFITIVWVMLWDPIEKLLFDSYFIWLRVRALRKLAAARIVFVYRPSASAPSDASLG
jgi:hypothetical protein